MVLTETIDKGAETSGSLSVYVYTCVSLREHWETLKSGI